MTAADLSPALVVRRALSAITGLVARSLGYRVQGPSPGPSLVNGNGSLLAVGTMWAAGAVPQLTLFT